MPTIQLCIIIKVESYITVVTILYLRGQGQGNMQFKFLNDFEIFKLLILEKHDLHTNNPERK